MRDRHRRDGARESRTLLPQVRIRKRLGDDIQEVTRLIELTRERDGYPPHWPPDAGRFVASRDELTSFVADDEGAVVGHIALNASSASPVMELATTTGLRADRLACVARLVVQPGWRRQGVARRLLEAATSSAVELARTPILDVVTWFDPAISLYESAGWTRCGQVTISFRSPCSELCSHPGRSIESYVYACKLGESRG